MLLEVRGVQAGYGKVTILHGLDLHIEAGEVVVALGRNGAGKSTLVKTIAGHLPTTDGGIILNEERIDGRASASRIANAGVGYVPQEHNIFGPMTVLENLQVSAISQADGKASTNASLARFPILNERAKQRASTLSGGERQILAISSALMTGPKLLLLDEPTSGLAPVFVEMIVDWIDQLVSDHGTGVLWIVEQNPLPVLAISSRTYIIEGGQAIKELPSHELLESGRLESALLDEGSVLEVEKDAYG